MYQKGGDQRAGMKSDCAGRVALPPQVVGDAAVPHAAWRLLHCTALGEGMAAAVVGTTLLKLSVAGILCSPSSTQV